MSSSSRLVSSRLVSSFVVDRPLCVASLVVMVGRIVLGLSIV